MNLGTWGEGVAIQYLKSNGYSVLERNFRCVYGEMDIIVEDKSCIIFIEVKTRNNLKFGLPCEAITASKLRHLKKIANFYIYQFSKGEYLENKEFRLDVIEILIQENKTFLNHLKSIA